MNHYIDCKDNHTETETTGSEIKKNQCITDEDSEGGKKIFLL